jgi:hypothetical protein
MKIYTQFEFKYWNIYRRKKQMEIHSSVAEDSGFLGYHTMQVML